MGEAVRRRWWPLAMGVWAALVVVGGLLTLYLHAGEGRAADPGDSPSATHEYVSCTSPPGEGDAPLLACVDTSER
ncbi:hypothetical protein GCM10012286_35960 [Streptomyces lasiicapitis]|uniref:Uncharacterized protein n=1 Tax=Streptomyces lasiicapitis TaxID=1923961 RepID=A0ABQ2M526_9ACTN|nr:hypothetical protein GCM10012286_35960 [Streptomyces lasiicapitis]